MKSLTVPFITLILSFVSTDARTQILGSLDFNGEDNYVEILLSPLNAIDNGDFTFEAWIKGKDEEQPNHPMIFSNRGNIASAGGILFFFHNQWGGSKSKLLSVQIDEFNYKFIDNGFYDGNLLDGQCHHVAVTRAGNSLSLYGDGILIGTSEPSELGTISFDHPLWIGKDRATNNTFNGTISQCRIWATARTQTEINDSKDIGLRGDELGLLAYWEMNSKDGQIVFDKTGKHDGYLGHTLIPDDNDPTWTKDDCLAPSVSTNKESINNTFKVMASPTDNIVIIENNGHDNFSYQIHNQVGQLILSKANNSKTLSININNFSPGAYLITVSCQNKFLTQRIVKL